MLNLDFIELFKQFCSIQESHSGIRSSCVNHHHLFRKCPFLPEPELFQLGLKVCPIGSFSRYPWIFRIQATNKAFHSHILSFLPLSLYPCQCHLHISTGPHPGSSTQGLSIKYVRSIKYVKYVRLRVWESVTVCDREGKDHVMSHYQFFHNSQFNVLFYILSYIKQI